MTVGLRDYRARGVCTRCARIRCARGVCIACIHRCQPSRTAEEHAETDILQIVAVFVRFRSCCGRNVQYRRAELKANHMWGDEKLPAVSGDRLGGSFRSNAAVLR